MKTSNRESPDARQKPMDTSHAETTEFAWKSLYRVGGAVALLAAGLEMANALIAVISSSTSGPAPSTVIGWFTLLQNNRLLGLLDLGLLDIAAVALLVPLFLAVSIALRRTSASFMAIATTLAFVGIGVYLATETAFSLLSLSSQYAAATTDAQRTLFEAAGQAMLAEQVGVGAGAYMAFFLMGVAGLIISAVMLRSVLFSNITAAVGMFHASYELASHHKHPFNSHTLNAAPATPTTYHRLKLPLPLPDGNHTPHWTTHRLMNACTQCGGCSPCFAEFCNRSISVSTTRGISQGDFKGDFNQLQLSQARERTVDRWERTLRQVSQVHYGPTPIDQ